MRWLLTLIPLVFIALPAAAQVEVDTPWIRATPPGAKAAAGYMTLRNKSAQPDRLVGASTPLAARVETHVHLKDGDIVRMREVKAFEIPAKGAFELKPGGAHLMIIEPRRPLKEGDKVSMTLKFERAGEMQVDFRVEPLTAQRPSHQH